MSGGARPPALAAAGLRLRRGARQILDGASFTLAPGERLAISGPSGCGKTTLLRILAGLERPAAGSVAVDGVAASEGPRLLLPPWRRGLQMVFQDLGLWPARTVLQNVADVARWSGAADARGRARELLQRLGLAGLEARLPGTLSGGEARRLAFARALAGRPRILLLDEPFTSLDPTARAEGFELLDRVLAESGAAVILVSHDPAEAERLGGRRLRFVEGRLEP